MTPSRRRHACLQRGASLVEVLIAFLVLSLTVVATTRLQADLRLTGDVARQRSEAVQLLQTRVEGLRTDAAGASPQHQETIPGPTTRYALSRRTAAVDGIALTRASAAASWVDRAGVSHEVTLDTAWSSQSPVYAATLTLAPGPDVAAHPLGRSTRVPRDARSLGDGRSVFKPEPRGEVALVFDDASGDVIARCRVDAALSGLDVTPADLGSCDRLRGSLLGGHVRFALGEAPSARQANDTPLPLSPVLTLQRPFSAEPTCWSRPMRTVRIGRGDEAVLRAVPLDARSTDDMEDTGERYAAFTCLIVDARWSGQLLFRPDGWSLGTTAGAYRICRTGHTPARYENAQDALRQQNFLVIGGEQTCPPLRGDAQSAQNGAPAALAQHQP